MKIKYLKLTFCMIVLLASNVMAQLGVNDTNTPPAANAILDVKSASKGMYIPRVTTAVRTTLSGEGMVVFDTNTKTFWFHNGTTWVNNWVNSGTNIYNGNAGNVGIGTTNPTAKLDVNGSLKYTNGSQSNARVLTSDGSGNASWAPLPAASGFPINIPEVVNWRATYAAGTTYALNDLVRSASPTQYFYSLKLGNIGNTPESSPAFWQPVEFAQLKLIHKSMSLPNTVGSLSSTNIISIQLAGTNTTAGQIYYHIRAKDAGSQTTIESGVINYLSKALTISSSKIADDVFNLGTMGSNVSPGFIGSPTQPGILISASPTFSTPAAVAVLDLYFRVINNGANNDAGVFTNTVIRIEP